MLRVLCIFQITVLYQMCLLQIFAPHSLDIAFHRAEVFNFTEVKFINYYFMDGAFGIVSKKSLPYPSSSGFSPMLICSSFSSFLMWKLKLLILDISFLIHVFNVINFPLSTAVTASHKF